MDDSSPAEVTRRKALAASVAAASRPMGLAKSCLVIARGEYPGLDGSVCVNEIRRLAARVNAVRGRIGPSARPSDVLADVLARTEGFHGGIDDYDDPEHSYLNRVLVRRRGLPILLSILWVEVARAAGWNARGAPFPGHFAVFFPDEADSEGRRGVYVDPFAGGRKMTEAEVMNSILSLYGGMPAVGNAPEASASLGIDWQRHSNASPRRILFRLLANLARSYEGLGDARRLERILSDQIVLVPQDPTLRIRRAEARADRDDRRGALADFNAALRVLPRSSVFDRVAERARLLAQFQSSEN